MDRRAVFLLRDLARESNSTVIVRGDCMAPLLSSGDEVRVRAKRFYLPGDVVVFHARNGELAAHRVVGWRPAGLVTKGDHCALHDAPVQRDSIIGAVVVPIRFRHRLAALRSLARIVLQRLGR